MDSATPFRLFLSELVTKRFPSGIESSFAYGSAVFKQKGDSDNFTSNNMVDMIFVVEDPERWHYDNINRNPSDYSIIRNLGSRFISSFGNRSSAGVIFNPIIKFDKIRFKYGVVSKNLFIDDLRNWDHLYVSGRLHKPVLWLEQSEEIKKAYHCNLENAVIIALLLQPEEFDEVKFYKDICSISYNGDIRTYFGIDRNKPDRIVTENISLFRDMYSPHLRELSSYVNYNSSRNMFLKDSKLNNLILYRLPRNVLVRLKKVFNVSEVKQLYRVESKKLSTSLRKTLEKIVFTSSSLQTLKGLLTTRADKSIKYTFEKVMKAMKLKITEKCF